MQFSKTALLLAILPFSIAATCDKSSALSWSTTSSGQAFDLFTCYQACGTKSGCALSCLQTACNTHCGSSTSSCYTSCLNDSCSAFYGSGSDAPNAAALQTCYKQQLGCSTAKCRRELKERATLTCSSSEGCYIDTQSTIFCLDQSTGEYRDDTGGRGNVNTGAYTSAAANGVASTSAAASTKATTAASTKASTSASTKASTAASTAISNAASSAATAAATSAVSVASVASSSAAAAATSKAAAGHVRVDAVVGALGLVLGLAL